jgi:anti-sigma regulatory factor (Ser/Thr protein kinase)
VPTTRLSVAGDPALALVVRIFIGSVTEQWKLPEPARDDLRLAASELFSGAVEAGKGDVVTFELSLDDAGLELRAQDVPIGADGPDLAGWTGRFELIRALFPDADVAGSTVRIRVPQRA